MTHAQESEDKRLEGEVLKELTGKIDTTPLDSKKLDKDPEWQKALKEQGYGGVHMEHTEALLNTLTEEQSVELNEKVEVQIDQAILDILHSSAPKESVDLLLAWLQRKVNRCDKDAHQRGMRAGLEMAIKTVHTGWTEMLPLEWNHKSHGLIEALERLNALYIKEVHTVAFLTDHPDLDKPKT